MQIPDQNQINAEESDYLYVKVSQLYNSGNGLFTAIDIYKEEIIAVFKGEVLTDKESDERAKQGNNSYFMIIKTNRHTNGTGKPNTCCGG